jgi:hypothetical protein
MLKDFDFPVIYNEILTLYELSTKTDSKQTMLLLEDIASKTKTIGFLNYLQELD